ncbi:MAG: DUF3618 domain-containing protein [Longimicrobiales bacterium]
MGDMQRAQMSGSGTIGNADEPRPRTAEEARREIEATRERLASTFDRLGHQLEQKKEEIREKADVLKPLRHKVRELPLPALAIAFGAGVLIGLLRRGRRADAETEFVERELALEKGEEAVVDMEGRRVYTYGQPHSFAHELRSVFAHQIGNAVVGAIAGLISAKITRHEDASEDEPEDEPRAGTARGPLF